MVPKMDFLVLSTAVLSLYHAECEAKFRNFFKFKDTQGFEKITSCFKVKDTHRFENIVKSPHDTRQYRGLKLKNKLKVLLISDPTTEKSAASLSVSAGSLNEYRDLPGLAHLLEHMLFLGSKKYPQENEYIKFVSEHAGSRNAFTLDHETKYFFDISPDYLVPALDRFAHFLSEPLIAESSMQREIMAIHSECGKHIYENFWRVHVLEKSLSKSHHPYNNFPVGDLRTLEEIPKYYGISVRDRLLKFHSKWYSANLMNLVVLGKESLDKLEKIVIKLFGKLKNKNVQRIVYNDHPYGPEQLKRIFYVVPVQDLRILKITFPTPDITDQYKAAPQRYLSHLISHKGPGSIYSMLREKELCLSLVAGLSDTTPILFPTTAPGFSFFYIAVNLTENGLDHVDDIIRIIFQYIKLLKTRGIRKWIFEELKKLKEMLFLFRDKIAPATYVLWLSSLMADIPFEDILTAHILFDKWEPKYIENFLSYLTPDNMTVIIQSRTFLEISNQTEYWFGTKYKVEQIPDDFIQKWNDVELLENLHLPKPNEFIPENFNLYPLSENESKSPYVLHESSLSRIWFKHDDKFKRPKLNIQIEIFSPASSLDPVNRNLTEMFVLLLEDSLNHYTYDTSVIKLTWDITATQHGIRFSLSGFNEKMPILLEKILLEMTNFKFDKKRFDSLKEYYIRWLKDDKSSSAFWQASFYLKNLLCEHGWIQSSLLEATNVLEYSNLERFIPELFSKIFIQGLIHGNCNEQKAMDIVNLLESSLKSPFRLLPQQLLPSRQVKIDDGHQFLYEVFENSCNSSCYYAYFQCSTESILNNAIIQLFLQIVEEPCFSILRTQEQLDYSVRCSIHKFGGVQGFVVRIHSEKHPLYLNSRVEEFLHIIHEILGNMTDEELEIHKTSLVTKKLVKPEGLRQQTSKYWREITSQMYNFDRDEMEIKEIQKLKKVDILIFFEEFLRKASSKRRKLSINIVSAVTNPQRPTNVPDNDIKIEDVTRFKSSSNLFPLPESYMKLAPMGTKPQ